MQIEQISKNIYCFPIELPNNPLRWLNCYVIRGVHNGRNLLIDTGFNLEKCREDLNDGMHELGLTPTNTDVFITHEHADHYGNAFYLKSLGFPIMMGRIDYQGMLQVDWNMRKGMCIREGMPQDIASEIISFNPAKRFICEDFRPLCIEEGHILCYGGYALECIITPGHTPGHICLYDRNKRILFSGDHILFDISPNINAREQYPDMLGMYLSSLIKVKGLEIDLALPAHRKQGEISAYDRIDCLLEHHRKRLEETIHIIKLEPGISAYQLAGKMHWKIKAKNWEDFPNSQRLFAHCETIAHLDYLRLRGYINRERDKDGVLRYSTGPKVFSSIDLSVRTPPKLSEVI